MKDISGILQKEIHEIPMNMYPDKIKEKRPKIGKASQNSPPTVNTQYYKVKDFSKNVILDANELNPLIIDPNWQAQYDYNAQQARLAFDEEDFKGCKKPAILTGLRIVHETIR